MEPTFPESRVSFSFGFRADIDDALSRYVNLGDGCPEVLNDAIRYSLLAPGKRLRPHLVLLSAAACGCGTNEAMPAACAVEMIHAYSLIHDDLPAMDDDDLRRGQPTCHRAFDEATAILAGDALQALAFKTLSGGISPSEIAARCCAELATAAGATGMVGGQVDDLAAQNSEGEISELESIHRRKTGAMIIVAVRLGGIIARATEAELGRLTSYGKNLGLAFQIVDDLLDFVGSEDNVGKRTQKDSQRGKLTFPNMLGVNQSRERAQRLIEQACQAIEGFDEAATGLRQLARFVVDRDY